MMKFRISTALMCFGLACLPWSSYLLPPPKWIDKTEWVSKVFMFVVYQFSQQFLFLGFGVALVSLCWFGYKRQWPAVVQFSVEMLVCFGAVLVLPDY